ncbi:MAG: fumarylacetoacetate hydrolase family protein [Prevotella sp.]|nr:fumarylacetoacetate hydrolase family protein [Prevotella sp.]
MKILAIGMNYIQHNKELDGALYKPKEPVIFSKVDSALLKNGKPFFIPDGLGNIEYEAELVVRICKLGKNIPQRFAHRYYDAVTVGIDFTARDLQRQLRAEGKPWEMCKSFDGSAVIGKWLNMDEIHDIQALNFRLDINGTIVQNGFSGDMLFSVDEIIAYVSRNFTLKTGDLLYTGTPVGVGPVHINDHLTGWIEDKKVLEFNVK